MYEFSNWFLLGCFVLLTVLTTSIYLLYSGGLRLPDVPSILKQKSSAAPEPVLYIGEHGGNKWEEEASEDSIVHSSQESSLAAEEDGREGEPDDDSESDWWIFKV